MLSFPIDQLADEDEHISASKDTEHLSPDGMSVSLECPRCGQLGTFEEIAVRDRLISYTPRTAERPFDSESIDIVAGDRRCPSMHCHQYLFFLATRQGELIATLPPRVIGFAPESIPGRLVSTLREAIKCHSQGCYRAGAMLVRRTLEELCDEHDATGKDLQKRIEVLKGRIILPAAFFEGLHDLRLLGNDAAHIAAKDYNKIGAEEVEIAIEFTKQVLSALYQQTSLIDRLKKLKKNSQSDPGGSTSERSEGDEV